MVLSTLITLIITFVFFANATFHLQINRDPNYYWKSGKANVRVSYDRAS